MGARPGLGVAEADLAGEYFAQLLDRFEQASAAVGGAGDLELEMAGLRVRLRPAGDGLRAGCWRPSSISPLRRWAIPT